MKIKQLANYNDKQATRAFFNDLINESGIIRNSNKLIKYIEADIKSRYEPSESEDENDPRFASYNGNVYEHFYLINDRCPTRLCLKLFSAEEIECLLSLTNDDICLSVCRRNDFTHEWQIVFELTEKSTSNENHTIDVSLELNTLTSQIKSLDFELSIEDCVFDNIKRKSFELN